MRQRIPIIVLPGFLMLLIAISSISLITLIPGVCIGDYFTYEMFGIYTSNQPNIAMYIPDFEKNNTDWTRITITAIEGSNVNQTYTLHFKNSSELTTTFQTNIVPQSNDNFRILGKGVPICASNLNSGEQIPEVEITINYTIPRWYASGVREINYASWRSIDEWGTIYFDRATGMLIELERTHRFFNSATGNFVEKTDYIRLIDTNRWQVNN